MNYSGTYLLADVPIRMVTVYDEVHQMCEGYRTSLDPVLTVTTTLEEIAQERTASIRQRQQENLAPYDFPDAYLETLAVYRKIAVSLLPKGILLMHGSVIAVDGQGYMFTALSGTGKSTHVRLWRQHFGNRAVMVNDDKPLVKISSGEVKVFGTPWDGKHHLSTNTSVPLKALVVLCRGSQNEIHPISAQEAFPTLLQQSFRTEDSLVTIQAMQLLSLLSRQVGLYCLHCNMDPEAAVVAYQGMNR